MSIPNNLFFLHDGSCKCQANDHYSKLVFSIPVRLAHLNLQVQILVEGILKIYPWPLCNIMAMKLGELGEKCVFWLRASLESHFTF